MKQNKWIIALLGSALGVACASSSSAYPELQSLGSQCPKKNAQMCDCCIENLLSPGCNLEYKEALVTVIMDDIDEGDATPANLVLATALIKNVSNEFLNKLAQKIVDRDIPNQKGTAVAYLKFEHSIKVGPTILAFSSHPLQFSPTSPIQTGVLEAR